MNLANLKDYWQLAAGIGGFFVFLVSFLWWAINNILKAKNTLDNHEIHLNEHKEKFKNIDSNVKKISFYLNELTEKIKKYIDPGDMPAITDRLKAIVETSLFSTNPVTPGEREQFEKYRQKAMFGQPFTTEEYEDFKLLGEKFKYELPSDKQSEFEELMTSLLSSLLTKSIKRFESDSRIVGKKEEVIELPWGTPVSDLLEKSGDARFYILKGVKAHGEIEVRIVINDTGQMELVATYELLPTLYEWEYQAQGENLEKALRIFPTKPGDYYLLAAAKTAGVHYRIMAQEVGYYYLRTTSFLKPDKQEEYQGKAKTSYPVYNIQAIVDTDIAEGLTKIERVEYVLPWSWPAELRNQVKTNSEEKFLLKELAYGPFVLTAKVYFHGGTEPMEMQEIVKLQEAGPRLL